MKKILVTRRLLRPNEEKVIKLFNTKLNLNDELYSQKKLIELSQDCDGILSSLTEKIDEDTINKLPDSVKIISNYAVGFGNIDTDAAKIAKSLGMIIHYHNRSKLSSSKENGAIYHKDIKSLFSNSDVLSISCPATRETEDLINKETLEYFPKGAVITNVARGDIVDDEALIEALNSRKVYAVGLDVYQGEPNLNPGYLKHKSAFILPHLGSASKQTRTAMGNLAIDNIDEFFKTGRCKNKVN